MFVRARYLPTNKRRNVRQLQLFARDATLWRIWMGAPSYWWKEETSVSWLLFHLPTIMLHTHGQQEGIKLCTPCLPSVKGARGISFGYLGLHLPYEFCCFVYVTLSICVCYSVSATRAPLQICSKMFELAECGCNISFSNWILLVVLSSTLF